jgi:uncharacterized protein YqeY
MTLETKINSDYIVAFKERKNLVKTLLSVVKGEFDNIKKNLKVESLPDQEALKILNKFAKNLTENVKVANDEKSKLELEVINSYLPTLMSLGEVESKVSELIASGVNTMPMIMKEFSNLAADKKMVSEVVKSKLT